MSPYYNSYNMEVANTLHNIYRNKIDHEDLHNDNLAGGSGFAADYHLDSGFGPTLGITSTSRPVPIERMMDSLAIPKVKDDELDGAGKTRRKKTAGGISGGKKTAKGISAGGISGGKKTAKGISAGGISAGGISAGAKPKRKSRKKVGGDFNDILDGVSHVANTAKDVAEAALPVAAAVAPLLALGKPKRKSRKKGGASLENPSREPYRDGGESDIPSAPLAKLAPSANKATVLEQPVEKNVMPGVGVGGKKPKRVISEKMKKRNELIKKLMKEQGLSLIDASKKIAAEKLPY
jgi:hypothetical protein